MEIRNPSRFLFAILLFCLVAECRAAEPTAFAVIDFEGEKGLQGTDGDWAIGLADFLQMLMALQQEEK